MTLIQRAINWISGKYVKTVSNQTIFGEGNISGGGPGGSTNWGDIGGTLSNQTDLNSELNNKLDKLTDAGEFVYTHEGSIQNSKGFIAGDTLLNSSAHIASAHTTYKAIQDLINDTIQDLSHTWSSEKINSLLTAALDCQVVATMPTNPTDNTLYLVGPKGTSPNIYYEKKLRVDGVTYDAGTTNIDLSGYQEKLESGVNIKTINNESILGAGNLQIDGGSMLIEDISALVTAVDNNTYNLISGKKFSDYKIIRVITKFGSSNVAQTIELTPQEFATEGLRPAGNYSNDRLIVQYVSDTSFKTFTGATGAQVKIVGYKNLPNSIVIENGINSGTTSLSSGTSSWNITVNIPLDATPTGVFASTEGNVGSIYVSTFTKISAGVYRVSGWVNVGSGATAKASIMWIKL